MVKDDSSDGEEFDKIVELDSLMNDISSQPT